MATVGSDYLPVENEIAKVGDDYAPVGNASGMLFAGSSKDLNHSSMPEHFSMVLFLYNSIDYYSFTIPFLILPDYAVL